MAVGGDGWQVESTCTCADTLNRVIAVTGTGICGTYAAAEMSAVFEQLRQVGAMLTEHDTVHDGWSDMLSLCAEAWGRYHVAVQQCATRSGAVWFRADATNELRAAVADDRDDGAVAVLWVLDGVVPPHPQQRLLAVVLANHALPPSAGVDGLRRADRGVLQHPVRLLLHTPLWLADTVVRAVASTNANGWVGIDSRCSAAHELPAGAAVEFASGAWRSDDDAIDAALARAVHIGRKLALPRGAVTCPGVM